MSHLLGSGKWEPPRMHSSSSRLIWPWYFFGASCALAGFCGSFRPSVRKNGPPVERRNRHRKDPTHGFRLSRAFLCPALFHRSLNPAVGFFFFRAALHAIAMGEPGRMEEQGYTVCRCWARGQFPNNPWGWPNLEARGLVTNTSIEIPKGAGADLPLYLAAVGVGGAFGRRDPGAGR